ncbi:MAG: hypothetical protein WDN45_15465 [Caulobacteraceae bacterium]
MTVTDTYLHKGAPAYRNALDRAVLLRLATFALLYTMQPLLPLFSRSSASTRRPRAGRCRRPRSAWRCR